MHIVTYDSRSNAMDYTISPNNFQRNSSHLISSHNVPTLNGRLVVNSNRCYDCIMSIPKTISSFFRHRYADMQLFFRAFRPLVYGTLTSSHETRRRIDEVNQLITDLFLANFENSENNRSAVAARFQQLTPAVRDLFFYVDQNYIDEFVRNPSRTEEMAREMAREAERVITFQRQTASVTAFYRMFIGMREEPAATTDPIDVVTTHDRGHRQYPDRRVPRDDDAVTPTVNTNTTIDGISLAIPGTIAYVQNAIPDDVQNKANEIARLKARFAGGIPDAYKDPVALDFIEVPVFDASHPRVQLSLRVDTLDSRASRHVIDKDSLEGHIQTGTTWSPAKCILCRHPEDGGIRREYLRIDTALQDEILNFLRARVGP